MSWTDERVEQLKNLLRQGSSYSQIAKILGGGVTRNAAISKAHRLGLSGSTKPPQPRPERTSREHKNHRHQGEQARPKLVVPPTPPPIPIEELEVPPEADRINLIKLNKKMCKWPIGNPGEETFRFCGRGCEPRTPYCLAHSARAYQPVTKRDRECGSRYA